MMSVVPSAWLFSELMLHNNNKQNDLRFYLFNVGHLLTLDNKSMAIFTLIYDNNNTKISNACIVTH